MIHESWEKRFLEIAETCSAIAVFLFIDDEKLAGINQKLTQNIDEVFFPTYKRIICSRNRILGWAEALKAAKAADSGKLYILVHRWSSYSKGFNNLHYLYGLISTRKQGKAIYYFYLLEYKNKVTLLEDFKEVYVQQGSEIYESLIVDLINYLKTLPAQIETHSLHVALGTWVKEMGGVR